MAIARGVPPGITDARRTKLVLRKSQPPGQLTANTRIRGQTPHLSILIGAASWTDWENVPCTDAGPASLAYAGTDGMASTGKGMLGGKGGKA